MNSFGPWKADDFGALAWHDVHVHGFSLTAFDDDLGAADLVLDIDYILAGKALDHGLEFMLCPAELVFHGVFGLRFELDYAAPLAGMCPFSIHAIEREVLTFADGSSSFRSHIPLNWPDGGLRFDAAGFTLTLTGTPVVAREQFLSPEPCVRSRRERR